MNALMDTLQEILPNMSDTEKSIAEKRFAMGYTAEEVADFLKYNLGDYSLEEFMQDMYDLFYSEGSD